MRDIGSRAIFGLVHARLVSSMALCQTVDISDVSLNEKLIPANDNHEPTALSRENFRGRKHFGAARLRQTEQKPSDYHRRDLSYCSCRPHRSIGNLAFYAWTRLDRYSTGAHRF